MSEPSPLPIPSHVPLRRTLAVAALAVLAAAALVACQPAVPAAQAASAGSAEPPSVAVARVQQSSLEAGATQVARIDASQRADLQARVAGPVAAVLFREGERVRAGQPLVQIDPRTFDAAVARARAELQLAQAREALTASEAERARVLHADRAIAAEAAERRIAAHAEAQAQRAAAQAALQTAELEREFTLVRAPIAGRIGRALVTAGNFVAAGTNATPLASIVAVSPLHVNFDLADRAAIARLAQQRQKGDGSAWQARILDADGQRELARAPIDFSDHSIEPATGTLRMRARLDQPNAGLLPGQYVRIQLVTGDTAPALLVPDKAIGTDQGQRFVLVVGDDGKVEYRAIAAGAGHGEHRIVTAGLQAGEQVIVSGLLRVRPGMTVKPQPAAAAEPAQAQASAPARS
jgi:multidrug efflux system membrane fusion protein